MVRILVIDDEEPIRDILQQVLAQAGYEVVEAQNGREGLQHYRQVPTDLVITDMEMPEKDGLETIRELRHDCSRVQIIAISGGDQTCLSMARQMGVQRTFQKPFCVQELLKAVQELVETQQEDTTSKPHAPLILPCALSPPAFPAG